MIIRAINAVYNFLVGDMRILIGTLVALTAVGLLARYAPGATGPLLFVLLTGALVLSLRHEVQP
ncbi:MAG: hypothetical protein R3C14_48265 [Caldilineaceae bacterium]